MPTSVKSSNTCNSLKPMNVFYIWYSELCRRINSSPLSIVKPFKPKNETVLDFVTDRIKFDEWKPILNALRNDSSLHVIAIRSRLKPKFLFDVDTDDKVRALKRKNAFLWTDFGMNNLVKSLTVTIKRSNVLTCMELDGVPMNPKYLDCLIDGLKKNKSLKILSFKHCPIMDGGCSKLCMSIRFMPNIEVLNLTACNLTSVSAQYIAKLIKHQQINRYCVSWHSSLRYKDPDVEVMAGLKRITLNNNPDIGDDGLKLILDELDDDLWIKAIDMQRCNVTEKMATRILDVIDYSKSLEIADFRHNDSLSRHTLEKIFNLLKDKRNLDSESEFQWCLSTTTVSHALQESLSRTTYATSTIQKSKSAPFRQTDVSKRFSMSNVPPLRRTKTFALLPKKPSNNNNNNNNKMNDNKNCHIEVRDVSNQLTPNVITTNQLNDYDIYKLERDVNSPEYLTNEKELIVGKQKIEITMPQINDQVKPKTNNNNNNNGGNNKRKKEFVFTSTDNRNKGNKLAQDLLEKIIYKEDYDDRDNNKDDEDEQFSYYFDDYVYDGGFKLTKQMSNIINNNNNNDNNLNDDNLSSCSNISLIRYVQDIKSDNINKCNNNKTTTKCSLQGDNCGNNGKKILVNVPPVR